MEVVEHEQGILQALGGHGAHLGVVQQVDQGLDVVAAQHGAQQLGGLLPGDQATGLLALGDPGQELGLDLGGVVHAGRHAVGEQIDENTLLARRRIHQQGDQFAGLLGGKGQGRDTERRALGDMLAIGL